jgi:hypothetical protein
VNTRRHHPDQPDQQRSADPPAPVSNGPGNGPADAGPASDSPPTLAEIAAFTRRLRALSAAGPDADPAELARFLADKAALFARIPDPEPPDQPDTEPPDTDDQDSDDDTPDGSQ